MPYPYKKFRQNPSTSLRVIRWTDRQTDRQTNRQTDRTKNITSFFGGGKKHDAFVAVNAATVASKMTITVVNKSCYPNSTDPTNPTNPTTPHKS